MMTKREFMNMIINGEINEEVKAFAENEIQKLDAANARKSARKTQTQIENEPIKNAICELLADGEKRVASAIAKEMNLSVQKVSALCRRLVDEGRLQCEEVKVPKKGMQKAYFMEKEEA